jgi:hypothetical protein
MKRRHFLRVAAAASAAAAVSHAPALDFVSAPPCRLRLALALPHTTVMAIHTEPVTTQAAVDAIPTARPQQVARAHALPTSVQVIEMLLEWLPDAQGGKLQWLVNGRTPQPLPLAHGVRYRLRIINATALGHCLHLQDHRFQLARVQQTAVSAACTHTLHLERYSAVDVDLVA